MTEIVKRMEDYTNEELLELTEVQHKGTIDLECAHGGVRLLPDKPDPPTGNKPSPDFPYYTIKEQQFINESDAREVADLIESKQVLIKKYQSGPGYSYVATGFETKRPSIETEMIFSEAFLSKVLIEKTAIEEAQKVYDKLKREYDDIAKARGDIVSALYDLIGEARQEKQIHTTLRNEFGKYMSLALGEKEIALRFMIAARPDQQEIIEENADEWVIHHVREKVTTNAD